MILEKENHIIFMRNDKKTLNCLAIDKTLRSCKGLPIEIKKNLNISKTFQCYFYEK